MKHDFKPEWIVFWTHRMKELHDEAVKKKEADIRKRLNVAEDGKEATNDLKEKYAIKVNLSADRRTVVATTSTKSAKSVKRLSPTVEEKRPSSSASRRERERSRSLSPRSRDRFSRERSRHSERPKERARERSRERSRERERERHRGEREREREWERERSRERDRPPRALSNSSISDEEDERFAPKRGRREEFNDYYEHPWHPKLGPPPGHYYPGPPYRPPHPYYGRELPYHRPHPHESYAEPQEDNDSNEPLTVVSVLRLLTAVEDLLGPSLGPKVIDLLAKALALEKVKANSADDLLLNEDNCVLFETIKEKLKGQLIAEVVEKHQIKAVKKAIKNIAGVVHMVAERERNQTPEEKQQQALAQSANKPAKEVASTSQPPVDKAEIAKKLAAALIAQGKTDITPEQLESLIQVYTEMEQKKRDAAAAVAPAEAQKPSTSAVSDSQPQNQPQESKSDLTSHKTHDEEFDLPQDASSALESLTDSDLQTLLQNFKDLSTEEQHHLIAYLKKLESVDPKRVEKLRKSVNIDQVIGPMKPIERKDSSDPKRGAPPPPKQPQAQKDKSGDMFYDEEEDKGTHYRRPGAENKAQENVPTTILDSDDDDDDNYSYDDIFKAASRNVKDSETKQKEIARAETTSQGKVVEDANFFDIGNDAADSNHSARLNNENSTSSTSLPTQHFNKALADTQSIIANLMGSLQKNVQRQRSESSSTSSGARPPATQTSTAAAIKSNMPFYQQQQLLENSASQPSANANQFNGSENYANATRFLQNLMPTLSQNVAGAAYSQLPPPSAFMGQQLPQQNQTNFTFQQMQQQQQQLPPQQNQFGQFQNQYPFNANNASNATQFNRRFF